MNKAKKNMPKNYSVPVIRWSSRGRREVLHVDLQRLEDR